MDSCTTLGAVEEDAKQAEENNKRMKEGDKQVEDDNMMSVDNIVGEHLGKLMDQELSEMMERGVAVHGQENQEVVGGVGGGATGANQEGSMDVDVGNLDSDVRGREMQMEERDNEDSNGLQKKAEDYAYFKCMLPQGEKPHTSLLQESHGFTAYK